MAGQDVEDMLSSVRRLVSSELPKMQRARVPEGPGALVLTENQRVEETRIGHNSQRKTLEDRIAELEQAVSKRSDEWEPDGSEDQSQHQPDRIVYKPVEMREDEEAQGRLRRRSRRLSEIALIETGPANEEESDDAKAATFRHEDAELHEVAAPENEGTSFDDLAESELVAEDNAQISPLILEATDKPEAEQPIADDIESMPDDANSPADEQLRDTIAEAVADLSEEDAFEEELASAVAASVEGDIEKAIAEGEVSPEPEPEPEPEPDALAVASTEPAPEPEPDAEPTVGVSAPLPTAEDLRPLVAALIREELQGELGERITRNVRKLVRQEIQRALTVREIE